MTGEGDKPDPPAEEPGTESQEPGQNDKQTVKALVKSGVGETLDKLERTADLEDVEKVQELHLKEKYGKTLLRMMAAQLVAANAVFVVYAWVGTDPAWQVDPNVMQVWLGATVIQVIGVVHVVTRNLFPRKDK
jgi:hypothetical protein